jgi:ABC-2 type transport system permease protein
MWQQMAAVAWAQFRITRNHLPRTNAGTILSWLALAVWYGMYAAGAAFLAAKIPVTKVDDLSRSLPVGLLAVFLFWQIIPLFTLSSGWSLELNKLQMYPISDGALFGLETVLRVTSAPEMIIVLTGIAVGLWRHTAVPFWAPFTLLLFIAFNLFVQLAIRDLILHSFERNRFRELFAVIVLGLAILPQMLLRTGLGQKFLPHFLAIGRTNLAPWKQAAALSTGRASITDFALVLGWTAGAFLLARWIFGRTLTAEESFQTRSANQNAATGESIWATWPSRIWRDPLAALVEKELRSLVRMPRFRVIFGMACLLGFAAFAPATRHAHTAPNNFFRQNLIPAVNLYGVLLLSDMLLLNALGFDRSAAQTYFVTPLSLDTVLKAKNIAAVLCIAAQNLLILFISALVRIPPNAVNIMAGLLATAVVTTFLLITGNFTSLAIARPIDPKQTFKKQAGAKMQLWLLGCSLGLFVLVGFAFLARYAFKSDVALIGVLTFEFLVGVLVYRLALESAVARGIRRREEIVQALSRSASPMSVG